MAYDIHIANSAKEASISERQLFIKYEDHISLSKEIDLNKKPYLRDIADFYKDVTIKGSEVKILLEELEKLNVQKLSPQVTKFIEDFTVISKRVIEEKKIFTSLRTKKIKKQRTSRRK